MNNLGDISTDLHIIFNHLKRYNYDYSILKEIPKNGIYVLFEVGESHKNLNRIVRIGTHTGENQLPSRLFQHFENENQRRSIFRKNIGRCILNKTHSNYLKYWDLPFTSIIDKEKNFAFIDLEFEKNVERQISEYLQKNFSFCVFEINSKDDRLYWESKIIATIAQAENVKPSPCWLGNYSPLKKIKLHGLWQIQGLYGPQINPIEFENLKKMILCQ
ncbi:MAG TPA: hypothetical protein VHO50_11675 [Bacteroidales bacterium]|nr:hypothetical protein [Bacteroidales bacterium]